MGATTWFVWDKCVLERNVVTSIGVVGFPFSINYNIQFNQSCCFQTVYVKSVRKISVESISEFVNDIKSCINIYRWWLTEFIKGITHVFSCINIC